MICFFEKSGRMHKQRDITAFADREPYDTIDQIERRVYTHTTS